MINHRDIIREQLMRISVWVLGVFAIVFGVLIVVGGRERWAGEAFQVALRLPGAPESWGYAMLLFGFMIVIGISIETLSCCWLRLGTEPWAEIARKLVGAGCTFAGLWAYFFGATFFWQYQVNENQVSNIGFAAWFFIGTFYLLGMAGRLKVLL